MGLRLGTGGAIPLETTLVDPAADEEGQKITTYGSGSYSVEPWFAADTTAHQQPATTRPSICGTVRSTDAALVCGTGARLWRAALMCGSGGDGVRHGCAAGGVRTPKDRHSE